MGSRDVAKPCPICGRLPDARTQDYPAPQPPRFRLRCVQGKDVEHWLEVVSENAKATVDAWNRLGP